VNGAETMMTAFNRARGARRLMAGVVVAATICGGIGLAAASAANIKLVGVSAQATGGRTAAVLIEATEPVAYAVTRPDPLTVVVDLRNVSVADAANQVGRQGPVSGVTLEQATGVDGTELARVRVALASPAAYKVRSARNVIRLELEPAMPAAFAPAAPPVPAALPLPIEEVATASFAPSAPAAPVAPAATAAATELQKIRTSHTRTSTTVTLAGNGRLNPSSLSEGEGQPRHLMLDFPNVSSSAAARTNVDGAFVKNVRVAANGAEPLTTRVTMEISTTATYHVERTGPDGRDLAVVFEGTKANAAVLVTPPARTSASADDDDIIPLAQALANGAALAPSDPIAALNTVAPPPANTGKAAVRADARVAPPVAADTRAAAAAVEKDIPASKPAARAPRSAQGAQQPPAQPPPPPPAQPTFSTEVPGSGQKQYTGHPINFDFEDADLRAVLRVFSSESGLNMIIDPQVQGRVNVLLNDVPWDQALDQILRSNKLGYTVEGNIIRIAPLLVLASEQEEQRKLVEAKALAGELRVQTFALSYAKGDTLSPLLTRSVLSSRGQIQVDARTNTLIIQDLPDRLATAQALIGTLDRPEPQVEVEARVVQTTRDFARSLGIQWGFNGRANSTIGNTTGLTFPNNGTVGGRVGSNAPGSGATQGPNDPRGGNAADNTSTVVNLGAAGASSALGLALGSINGAFNLDVALTALENTGKGRILSTPRLTTQNNQTAEVAQGVQIPIQTVANNTVAVSFKDATLKLQVTPQITNSGTVIMNVSLENATPDFARQVNGIPPINTQRALTTVQVSDGATTVIGGIFTSQEQSTNDRTPILHRVPILKWLFQRNTFTDSSNELLIFITPRILRG
jgi:type IV pilus assembly protein PilQ